MFSVSRTNTPEKQGREAYYRSSDINLESDWGSYQSVGKLWGAGEPAGTPAARHVITAAPGAVIDKNTFEGGVAALLNQAKTLQESVSSSVLPAGSIPAVSAFLTFIAAIDDHFTKAISCLGDDLRESTNPIFRCYHAASQELELLCEYIHLQVQTTSLSLAQLEIIQETQSTKLLQKFDPEGCKLEVDIARIRVVFQKYEELAAALHGVPDLVKKLEGDATTAIVWAGILVVTSLVLVGVSILFPFGAPVAGAAVVATVSAVLGGATAYYGYNWVKHYRELKAQIGAVSKALEEAEVATKSIVKELHGLMEMVPLLVKRSENVANNVDFAKQDNEAMRLLTSPSFIRAAADLHKDCSALRDRVTILKESTRAGLNAMAAEVHGTKVIHSKAD